MSKTAKDVELSKLAKLLRDVPFKDEGGQIAALFAEIERDDAKRIRNAYLLQDGKTWGVKIHLAGAYRYLGYTPSGVNAARFADMATLRFWSWRLRGLPEPSDRDFTFSRAQVEFDSRNETYAGILLDDIERHFKAVGVIVELSSDLAERKRLRAERDRRRTVRGDVLAMHEETMAALGSIARGMTEILKQLKKQ